MTNRIKNADLPFINLSKENLILIYDSLEAEQAGKMLFALTDYIYKGIEPTFESKIEKGVWNNIMLLIDRKAESYFKKAEVARENGKKGGRPKTTDVDKSLTTGLPNTIKDEDLDRDLDIIVDYQVNNKPQDDLSKEAIGRVNKQMNVLNGDERLNFEYRISEIMENKRQKIWNTITT